ncbi:high-affinity glucose transporter [Fusarium phyllophilum]|uniref:High-affinity glucose transporter n=1 Tax=Fusarium phyllophilum TaxID=47803 RepID=A0A8H5JXJ8_9HYPO|nr:high-affinity glucose transporter [Fusarium phyllophilum]
MIFFVPFSPRWLVLKDRYDEAGHVLARLHDNEDDKTFVEQEFLQIRTQIQLERDQGNLDWFTALWTYVLPKNFQSVFYQTVGFTGRTSLLISGVYGMIGIIGQVIYLVFVADKMPRTRTLWSGSIVLCVVISICMALSAEFRSSNNDNQTGARGAIASIFLYSMSYAIFFNAMIWVVPSELFPFFLRTKGMALAVAAKAMVAVVLSQITPLAIANVGWRYFSLFIASNAAAAVFYFFFLPKTSRKSLEEIAALFEDDVVISSSQAEAKISLTADAYPLEHGVSNRKDE